MVFSHEPFQGHGIPEDDAIILCHHILDGSLHVIIGHNLFSPTLFHEIIMTKTPSMHNHTVVLQVFTLTDMDRLILRYNDTMGKELDDVLTIETVLSGIICIHS